jgi:hypothetical protein
MEPSFSSSPPHFGSCLQMVQRGWRYRAASCITSYGAMRQQGRFAERESGGCVRKNSGKVADLEITGCLRRTRKA